MSAEIEELPEKGEVSATPYNHGQAMENLAAVIAENLSPIDMTPTHHFAHGTYGRELFIAKGSVIVGKIHRHSCINVIVSGEIRVVTAEGSWTIKGPTTFVSPAGVQRAVYAIEDTIWITIHPWVGEPNLDLIEAAVIAPSYEALDALK